MIEAILSGKLIGTATEKQSAKGTRYVQAKMRVTQDGEEALFVMVTAFAEQACDALVALTADSGLSVAGTLKVGLWKAEGKEARISTQVVANAVLTAHHAARVKREVQQ